VANVGPVAVPATSAGVGGLGIGLMAMLAAVARRLVKPVVQAALRLALRLGRSWRYGGLASLPACQLAIGHQYVLPPASADGSGGL